MPAIWWRPTAGLSVGASLAAERGCCLLLTASPQVWGSGWQSAPRGCKPQSSHCHHQNSAARHTPELDTPSLPGDVVECGMSRGPGTPRRGEIWGCAEAVCSILSKETHSLFKSFGNTRQNGTLTSLHSGSRSDCCSWRRYTMVSWPMGLQGNHSTVQESRLTSKTRGTARSKIKSHILWDLPWKDNLLPEIFHMGNTGKSILTWWTSDQNNCVKFCETNTALVFCCCFYFFLGGGEYHTMIHHEELTFDSWRRCFGCAEDITRWVGSVTSLVAGIDPELIGHQFI